jgi:hypothetical protein
MVKWGRVVVVAVNVGTSSQMNSSKMFGLPAVCHSGGAVQLTKLDSRELNIIASDVIPGFQATAMRVLGERLYLGGHVLDHCAMSGKAALYRLTSANVAELFWKENDVSVSSIAGLAIANGQLLMAVQYQRTLAVQPTTPFNIEVGAKRVEGEEFLVREAAVIRLSSKDGTVVDRRNLSAGVGIFLQGIELVGGNPIVYGSLGGQPAMTNNSQRLP